MARAGVALTLAVIALLAASLAPAGAASFVSVSGSELTLDGAPFYFLGGNAHWLADPASSDQDKIDALFGVASALGMKVIRTWAFQPGSPFGNDDFSLLDYAVASAARHNLRLILALGNTWKAYLGPEKWLGDPAGKTIADFYAEEGARARYRAHIGRVTSRDNPLTGLAYGADPTILAYDVLNEPRCPGCGAGQMSKRDAWLDEMAAVVRENAPNQLIFMGSEGFYGSGSPHIDKNPGAGSACEGDSFESDAAKSSAATAHVYFRQVEGTPDRGWSKPGFDTYVPYLAARLDLHESVSSSLGKPLIIEEFGLTERFFDRSQVQVVVAVVLDRVVRSKQQGKALAGALIWGLVPPGSGGANNQAGYNIDLDGGASASNVGLGSNVFQGGSGGGGGGANSNSSSSNNATTTSTDGGQGFRRRLRLSSHHRRLQQPQDVVEDTLDAFRRGPQRAACANSRAAGWTFPYDFAHATGLNAEAVKAAVGGASVSSLFKEAASKL